MLSKRGQKSAADLAVTVAATTERLSPPLHLSDAERAIWLEVVNDQAAEAFRPTHIPLLEQYCRHVIQSRLLADEILNFQREWLASDDGLKRYDRLLKMQDREGRAASSLATRLRITRQAQVHKDTAGRLMNRPNARKHWEIG